MSKERNWTPIENPASAREYLVSRVLDELNDQLKGGRPTTSIWDWLDTMDDRTLLKILSKERRAMYDDYMGQL
jgi:hypothetical protein